MCVCEKNFVPPSNHSNVALLSTHPPLPPSMRWLYNPLHTNVSHPQINVIETNAAVQLSSVLLNPPCMQSSDYPRTGGAAHKWTQEDIRQAEVDRLIRKQVDTHLNFNSSVRKWTYTKTTFYKETQMAYYQSCELDTKSRSTAGSRFCMELDLDFASSLGCLTPPPGCMRWLDHRGS